MEPRQVAAALGREIDTGFAAAFESLGSSGMLNVGRIVTRIGGLPTEVGADDVEWSSLPWQAEVTLHPVPSSSSLPAEGDDDGTDPEPSPGEDPLPHRVAALPTSALRGVGPAWEERFAEWGITSVGDLAETDPGELLRRAGASGRLVVAFVARARLATSQPPRTAAPMAGSVLDVALATPAGAHSDQFAMRDHCMRLIAALDLPVTATLSVT